MDKRSVLQLERQYSAKSVRVEIGSTRFKSGRPPTIGVVSCISSACSCAKEGAVVLWRVDFERNSLKERDFEPQGPITSSTS